MISQLGPYLIDEELAEGGMARVFRARLRGLGGFEKTLVIKQIRPELAKDPRFVELFVREANTLVLLSHPHIVPVYELGAADGTYYLSMEYVEGATITRMLEDGPLGPALVAHLGAQICEALEYAHGRFGILHRDITPRNIIVDGAGHGRLLDFGIAAAVDVIDHDVFGSPGYMAPEQVRAETMSPASDLFSLGCVLYEALTGRPAFSKTAKGTLGLTPPFAASDDVPEVLHQLVHSMLAPGAEQRPASAAEVARKLRGFLAQASPQGVLEEMQTRAAQARAERPSPAPIRADKTAPGTTRLEAKVLATSPVLTEMLRSAPGVMMLPVPRAPAPVLEEGTRPMRERSAKQPAPDPQKDTTNSALTVWMLRAWPLIAVLTLLVAGLLAWQKQSASERRPPTTSVPGAASRATSPPQPAPILPTITPAEAERDAGARGQAGETAPNVPVNHPKTPADEGTAGLSVNAVPWAEVIVDGRAQGTTPLRKLKLRAGAHVIQLRCPPLGRETKLKVELTRNRDARIVVDLSVDPPRSSVDGARQVR